LPREVWGLLQEVRSLYIPNARCGPHFSFIDPFVVVDSYPDAAVLLRKALKNFPPFECTLSRFNYFEHSKTGTLYLEPTFNPPDALDQLLSIILDIFPQCNDQLKKSKSNKFVPHMTIGVFKSMKTVENMKKYLESIWVPIRFNIKELYLLNRFGGDIFVVKHVVPLGLKKTVPYFGRRSIQSNPNNESKSARTIVACGLPDVESDEKLMEIFQNEGYSPCAAELLLNPGKEPRNCGLLEFATKAEADNIIRNFYSSNYPTIYLNPLYMMVFGDEIGGTCNYENAYKKIMHKVH